MTPEQIMQMFNILAPTVFSIIGNLQAANPAKPYRQVLEDAGVVLDAESVRLLADMAKAIEEGAEP